MGKAKEMQQALPDYSGRDYSKFDYYDPAKVGAPGRPKYDNQTLDPTTGGLKDQYQLKPQTIAGDLNTSALEKYRSYATSDGPSPWAKMQGQALNTQTQDALGRSAQDSAGQMAQARSGLSMRGGLSGGAAALMQQQGMRNQMGGSQDIRRAALGARQNIGLEDQKMKMSAMSQLPGMELQALQPKQFDATQNYNAQQFNLANTMKELGGKRDFDMKTYEEQMKGYAAYQASEAQKFAARR
jgi:hypothetical protein